MNFISLWLQAFPISNYKIFKKLPQIKTPPIDIYNVKNQAFPNMKKAPATIFSFFEKGERMSSESNIYVFSDNPEARERCKNFPVNVLGYKPAAENSPIIQKVLTWFGDSK